MEQSIIISSERKSAIWLCLPIPAVAVIIYCIMLFRYGYIGTKYSLIFDYSFSEKFERILAREPALLMAGIIVLLIILFFVFLLIMLSKEKLFVAEKRIYGHGFIKQVDLPVDFIAAIELSVFNGINISTSSGMLHFHLISNRDDIYKAVSNLLNDRQKKAGNYTTIQQQMPQSNADELKKYKELFDDGVITQVEFDAKKKQLLGL